MKKKVSLFLIMILCVFTFAGCGSSSNQGKSEDNKKSTKDISFVTPDGLTAIAVAKLIKEKPEIKSGYNVNYTIEQNSDSLVTSVMKSEPDIAIVPSNVAATVFNKNKEYKIAGTVGFGSFYIGTTNQNQSVEDLKGKEVYNIGKGLTPDIIARTILKEKGIDVDKEINFSYVNTVNELAPIILSGKSEYAVIPEPALSTVQSKNDKFNVMLNLNEEWKKLNDSQYGYPQSTIIVKKELLENDKEFVSELLKQVKDSEEWIYNNKETVGDYCEEIGVSAKKPIVVKAIDRSNIKYVGIKDCYKEYETYFKKLNEFDSKTIGGSIPNDEIFMEK
ncbi:ABC transporter substrate-binding protein [Clostridium beijerinckii]|jgi:ABC-type nitrate/sulfonate/bicarbonate transport systems, periplasmic components|uniref:ABC transporter substrate-binding protein n=2 Tax=Clostridium beijerinckii TaxID=1520 RepID=A0AAE2RUA1_CLOBE|nr:ABC transporter substrate-binding protein [Clostridium beijerinckii]ABR33222.1 putative sulfonate/nitrate transport system substrate-binding protein [Clostridium beijerinckii NCIMB 8052]AIU00976.1 putative sulfonate/nitrate transport system substrate-binding protein [Clostridium beijerinckii ATCC 35702]MBF7811880.1 ABC transporter substrate-binding protein [Clostridium beijerinckii]NOW92965.1 NitT/TauT family transport system substrate-binding protein [Clostridium beijerinckii]NRT25531.1 Ni